MFYILKQFLPNTDIWVAKLNNSDPEYTYSTMEEAEATLPSVQALYPNNQCKVSTVV
jgi:hypothetical protein